ncbi:DUF2508 family protein [Alicyclobacillus sp. ALC3]|uniref:DUF2508 family protein n=1 Tax=Alicyclobacillus sp. ALC3 TaxID=2796143 RepID=UPI002377E90F|nr:DUF2508 family protein [Alicyclobacillus sp. ALC3]WDL99022.1 DUF2508 family protein [Alicyclobacillus sp. ALC3]
MTSREMPALSDRERTPHAHIVGELPFPDAQSFTDVEVAQFVQELRRARDEVVTARRQFDTVTDPLLVDHIVFRLGAAEKRFNYLFQMAKRLSIAVDGVNWGWYEED